MIFTDQKSLRHLMEQRITTSAQHEWMVKLLGFQFDMVYKSGVENKVVDALSRQHEDLPSQHHRFFPYMVAREENSGRGGTGSHSKRNCGCPSP